MDQENCHSWNVYPGTLWEQQKRNSGAFEEGRERPSSAFRKGKTAATILVARPVLKGGGDGAGPTLGVSL